MSSAEGPRPGTIITLAGIGSAGDYGDGGPAAEAMLNRPYNLAVGPRGDVYFGDYNNHRVRRVDSAGTITTVAGTGEPGDSGDGGPATMARLNRPLAVALAADGSLLIADTENDRVRQVLPDGSIRTLIGCGQMGSAGLGGPPEQAQLNRVAGVAVGADGAVYVADRDNRRLLGLEPSAP